MLLKWTDDLVRMYIYRRTLEGDRLVKRRSRTMLAIREPLRNIRKKIANWLDPQPTVTMSVNFNATLLAAQNLSKDIDKQLSDMKLRRSGRKMANKIAEALVDIREKRTIGPETPPQPQQQPKQPKHEHKHDGTCCEGASKPPKFVLISEIQKNATQLKTAPTGRFVCSHCGKPKPAIVVKDKPPVAAKPVVKPKIIITKDVANQNDGLQMPRFLRNNEVTPSPTTSQQNLSA